MDANGDVRLSSGAKISWPIKRTMRSAGAGRGVDGPRRHAHHHSVRFKATQLLQIEAQFAFKPLCMDPGIAGNARKTSGFTKATHVALS
jgi:hypothetical protein